MNLSELGPFDVPPDQEWYPRECPFCTQDAALDCRDPECRAEKRGESRTLPGMPAAESEAS